uniref:Retrovirus-related Pol polyprotein from transposon TNT 1-94 n=1 Tax=Noccaea caerulescens TaxID=107243 RepID=A0A1J3DYP9_NOCCA
MWKYKLLGQLEIQGLASVLEDDFSVYVDFGTCLSDVILRKVMDEPTSRDMWRALDTFLKLVADLASLKVTISDEDQAIQLLTSLPPAYEPLVHTLKYGTGKDTLTVREVKSSVSSVAKRGIGRGNVPAAGMGRMKIRRSIRFLK